MKWRIFYEKIGKILLSLSTVFSIMITVLPSVNAKNIDLTADLKGYYNFENVSGTEVPNEAGSSLNGTLVGNGITVTATEFGKSLHFDSTTDSYMKISQAVNSGAESFSISLWHKLDKNFERNDKNMVLLQQNCDGRSLLTLKANNKYHSFINDSDKTSTDDADVSVWQHVTFAYDAENKKLKFFINGILDSEQDAGNSAVNKVTDLLLGRHKSSGTDPWSYKGDIDEVRYYGKYVTSEEAAAIYNDKAAIVEFPQLTSKIREAQNLYDINKVAEDETVSLNLKSSIDRAKALTASSSVAKIDEAISDLDVCMAAYQAEITVQLNVTEEIQRNIDSGIFGINHRYAFNGYGSFDSTEMKVKDNFAALYDDSNFGSIRYPGGTISNLYQWKTAIGPKENRIGQIHGFYNNPGQNGIAPNFGLGEIGTFAQEYGSEIIYVYGFGRGSAQDAADLVEYLNAPVKWNNANGGVDWAQVRASYGHPKPYNVRYFEIGNENNQGGIDGTISQQYWTQFVEGGAEDAYIQGGLVKINKQFAVLKDNWNKSVSDSDGTAGQIRYMRYANPNPMTGELGTELADDFEAVKKGTVHVFVGDEEWSIVDSFDGQSGNAKVCTVDYRDGFVEIAKKMKETAAAINAVTDSTKKCHVYSSFETDGFVNKMNNRGYNDYYDGLTIHPYSQDPNFGSGDNPGAFYDQAMKLAESFGIDHVKHYVDIMPEGKVPVISEYGIFRSTDTLVRSQTHAIYIAKVIMEYVRLGSPYIQKHCLVDWYSKGADSLGPTQQAVIQAVPQDEASTQTGEGEFKFFATPSAKVFKMLNSGFGENVLDAAFDFTDTISNGVKAYSSLVTKAQDVYQLC